MEGRFKNNLAKKNRLTVLICTMIIIVGMETLAGCSTAGENAENLPGRLETEDLETKDIQAESIQKDESLPESGGDFSGAEQLFSDYAVSTGGITIALYESKQHITDRLNENGLEYNEYDSDMKYSDSVYNKYDSYYMVGELPLGTDESQGGDASLCVYFTDGICVRLELLNGEAKTDRNIHKGDSCSQLIEQYGDSFEKHVYAAHGRYEVYRYSYNDCICEFSVLADYPDSVQGVDIYATSLYPIYDYGEELIHFFH